MDSSPDLSLKLRRGSNDSRDSYYMDFAQGIDSDIEEVATVATAPPNVDIPSDSSDSQMLATLPPVPVTSDLDSHEKVETELAIDDEALPLSPPPPSPPPPLLESISPLATIPTMHEMSTVPVGPLTTSAITNLSDNSTTDEDEDLSQITPLPMPILPPLNTKTDILQMSKIPLVDDDEG